MYEIMHVGVPVTEPVLEEFYAEGLKVHISGPDNNPFKFEYLRFEEGTPLHPDVVNFNHIAYKVPNIDTFIKDHQALVLNERMTVDEHLDIAFVKVDGTVIELMETK
ncbi:VOC family protein [Acetobacterium carbinolicum]|uniref:VOC family protein n=1 Tax=Acetobacterium carbinolicum TaxID=52690 RepID=UPI0039C9AEE4